MEFLKKNKIILSVFFLFFLLTCIATFPLVFHLDSAIPGLGDQLLVSWAMSKLFLIETMREYYNTAHFHPMVNEYSGYSPIAWEKRADQFQLSFPSTETVEYLKLINITYIILHKKDYDLLERNNFTLGNKKVKTWHEVDAEIKKYHSIHFVNKYNDDYIYEIIK